MEKPSLTRRKVLVVDSAKNQRELYKLILEDAGYEVTTAQDGEQALLLARERCFNLVLTDDKTTGTGEIVRVIDFVKQNPSVFVLMIITGSEKMLTHGTLDSIKEGLRGAMFDYLEKPVDRAMLLDVVESAVWR